MSNLGDELIRLASADNFRDVAGDGYVASDGTPLRRGVFFRSNELQLTHEDASTITDLGITAIYDLREATEVEAHPDVELPGTSWHHVEVTGIPHGVGVELADPAAAEEALRQVYRRFVTDPASRASFATLLRGLAASTSAQLFHCTAGKDRTGWASALLLRMVGVAEGVVLADYLRTNDIGRATRTKYLAMVREHLGEERVPVFERIMVADASYLAAADEAVESTYGGLEAYLRDGLGLDEDTVTALRARLLSPA
ncbi:tyrosine-protein phosphatase [Nocardioides sp.]|uniref:tyrosine-protein phosphatase n=1 Tax=Nocardioides sp. TaxID=35761 RepID=UPI00321BCD48